jgi:transcriptional regulator with XRE-family HTH domain
VIGVDQTMVSSWERNESSPRPWLREVVEIASAGAVPAYSWPTVAVKRGRLKGRIEQ